MPLPRRDSQELCHDPEGGLPRLLEIMSRLRDPETGCPWDIAQNYATIVPYTIEEAYEVADAVAREDWSALRDELGDLLLQVVYFAQMAGEDGHFDFDAVTATIADKMVTRHPHIFGTESRDKSPEQQSRDWEAIKAVERAARAPEGHAGTLDGVALGLPALTRAVKLQKRAARVGFDWPDAGQVVDKIAEEARELAEARHLDAAAREEEFGDLMFVMANLARHLGIDPEAALRAANAKFERRFRYIEARLAETGSHPAAAGLEAMEALWQECKRRERGTG